MLVAVNGVPVRGSSVQAVAKLLLGAEGSPVEVSFQRQTTVFTTTLLRRPSHQLASSSARDVAKRRSSIENEEKDSPSQGLLVEIQALRSELAGHRTATSEAIAGIRTHLSGAACHSSHPPHPQNAPTSLHTNFLHHRLHQLLSQVPCLVAAVFAEILVSYF